MSDSVFYGLRGLLNEILIGDSDMSPGDFKERVHERYNEGDITGSQYDWLMNNID